MTTDIIAAIDQTAANTLLHAAESAVGTLSKSGSGSLGPFTAGWSASASFTGGTVTLEAPDTVSIDHLKVNYSLDLHVGIDLSFLDFCIPQVCIWTPWGTLCTPTICVTFPTISVNVPFSTSLEISADFGILVRLTAGTWIVSVVIQSVPTLDLGPGATLLLTAIGTAISVALLAVPFIGPLLSIATAFITAAFGLAEVTGLLGSIVTLFVSGLTFKVWTHSKTFQVLPTSPPFTPAVSVVVTSVTAGVQATTKNELVLSVGI
jgi:hypothetical protein